LQKAIVDVIPRGMCSYTEYNMPGWNPFEIHDTLLDWVAAGKPQFGLEFELMRKSRRATFKLAVRYHKNNMEQLKADACAEVVLDPTSNKF